MSDETTTDTIPPGFDVDDDGGDDNWSRVSVSVILPDGNQHEVATQLYDTDARDPDRFATELLNAALALATLRGPDHVWALRRHLSTYGGLA